MQFDPQDPIWPDRDRFVASKGRASILDANEFVEAYRYIPQLLRTNLPR
jgi:transketolase N-terminal domain/subunit